MPWVQLFKRWITLPSGQISIQWIEKSVFLILIHWIMIHPMEQPGPGKQITQNIKKERQKENDHPFITLRRKQIFLANKLQYLYHPIKSKLTYKLFI